MSLIQAIILGLVQGLTEFIPISSSAHLILIPWLLHWPDPGLAFDIALHLGTLAAVLAYFWPDWLTLIRAFLASLSERRIGSDPHRRLVWLIGIGSLPGGLAGFLADDAIEAFFHAPDAPHTTGAMLLIAGLMMLLALLLWLAERFAAHRREMGQLTLLDAVLIGCAQALAILPGVSRSGSTITAGLGLGLKREVAARFSFLLATPIIAGSGVKAMLDLAETTPPMNELALLAAGLLTAAISGYLCIHYLLRYLQRHSTIPFILYRLALGLLIIATALTR